MKRYKSEPGSEVVRELFEDKLPTEDFVTSHFAVLEFTAVAARMRKGREIRQRQYERLVASFLRDLVTYEVRVLPVEDVLVEEALSLLPEYALRAPDALHMSTALTYARRIRPVPLCVVSGDRDLTDACRQFPLPYLDPEESGALARLRGVRMAET